MQRFALLFLFIKICVLQNTVPIKFLLIYQNRQSYVIKWVKDSIEKATGYAPNLNIDFEPIVWEENNTANGLKVCSAFEESASMIIDISLGNEDKLKLLSMTLGIPYVKIDVTIAPQLKLLEKYLDLRNSTDVAIIFENLEHVVESIYHWIDSTRMRLLLTEKLDKITARRFRTMRPAPSNFAILSSSLKMEALLNIARSENLISIPERWILVFLDFNGDDFNYEILNKEPINVLQLNKSMCCSFLDTVHCSCPKTFNLQEIFFELCMEQIYKTLDSLKEKYSISDKVSCKESTFKTETKHTFNNLLGNLLAQKSMVTFSNEHISLKIFGDMDTMNKSGQLSHLASYSDDTGIKIQSESKVKAITPFFRVGMTHSIPWSYKERDPNTGEVYWTGYCADFLKKLSEVMGFNYEIVEPKNGTFGKKQKNGYWDGVIGDLARGETDIGLTALTMTADREEIVDFVAPYFEQSGITIVMRKPVRKVSLFKFMTVLKLEVWLSIVAALVVTGCMIWFLDKYSPYSSRNNREAYSYPCS